MSQSKDDTVRLLHMLEYALKAAAFTKGKSRSDLNDNEMLAMATIHAIEIIGEAASTVSQELQDRYPKIPWDQIIGTRNRLVHGYIEINLDIIWAIITTDLPPLISNLKRALK